MYIGSSLLCFCDSKNQLVKRYELLYLYSFYLRITYTSALVYDRIVTTLCLKKMGHAYYTS